MSEHREQTFPEDASGVLYGPKLHLPTGAPATPSKEPGFGTTRQSVCGYFTGIVYDIDWIAFHHPDVQLCLKCWPDGVRQS